MDSYKRPIFQSLKERILEPRHFIQVLAGPRQVGKTTLIRQLLPEFPGKTHYISADEPGLQAATWLVQHWHSARQMAQIEKQAVLLVIDEIQKVPDWSKWVKELWDEDTLQAYPIKVVLLGSAPLLLQQGLSESLAGRFEVLHATHWSFLEMQQAFSWTLEQYIYFGGYPGAAQLINDEDRWARYIKDSLIETTLSRDILLMVRVDKPALLRRLFQLGCRYSAKLLSYQKMLGQLQDAGNTTTLAHYLRLLDQANMLAGLEKYAGEVVRKRGSSPKFQVYNTAFLSAQSDYHFIEAKQDPAYWGQLVESAVGAYLLNQIVGTSIQLFYWRRGDDEVDFILQKGNTIIALEVKTQGLAKTAAINAFAHEFHPQKILQIGGQGIPLERFFSMSISELI